MAQDSLLTASLRNVAPCHVAFKIKTTATDRYRVRPNIGVGVHSRVSVTDHACVMSIAVTRRLRHRCSR